MIKVVYILACIVGIIGAFLCENYIHNGLEAVQAFCQFAGWFLIICCVIAFIIERLDVIIASAIRDGFDLLPGRYKDNKNFPSLAEILIDKKRQGCLISGNFNLLCVNPLSCKHPSSQETWVAYMMSVFMHEATHILQSYHDDEFCVEQNALLQDLIADDIYNQLAGKFRTIWLQHNLDIVNASNLFDHSVNKI